MTTQNKLNELNSNKDWVLEELQSFYQKKLTTEDDLLDFQACLYEHVDNMKAMIQDIDSILSIF